MAYRRGNYVYFDETPTTTAYNNRRGEQRFNRSHYNGGYYGRRGVDNDGMLYDEERRRGYSSYGRQPRTSGFDQTPINAAYYPNVGRPTSGPGPATSARYTAGPQQRSTVFTRPSAFRQHPGQTRLVYRRSRTAPARMVQTPYQGYFLRYDGSQPSVVHQSNRVGPRVTKQKLRSTSQPTARGRPVHYRSRAQSRVAPSVYAAQPPPSTYRPPPQAAYASVPRRQQQYAYAPPPAESFYDVARPYTNRGAPSQAQYRQQPFIAPQNYAIHRAAMAEQRYPILWRYLVKLAQVLSGIIALVLVISPGLDEGFSTFVIDNDAQGQVAVIVLVSISLFMTIITIITIYNASRYQSWRNADSIVSTTATILTAVAAVIEAWYAMCYPPYGVSHPAACTLWEWIVATIVIFVMMLMYLIDLMLALRTGVTLL